VKINEYGQVIINEHEAFEALYSGKIKTFEDILIDGNIEQYNKARQLNADSIPKLESLINCPFDSKEMFDESNQCNWFMPEEYKSFPIHQWLTDQCKTEEELARVDQELLLFIQHGMFDLLFYLKYLVDTMRANKIVWGVGRGSSVASYVLFLIGVHKIDSLKYNLDIHEFLK
jgi:DNA polymerase III alpha subunit